MPHGGSVVIAKALKNPGGLMTPRVL
jgi:hypothetical protein